MNITRLALRNAQFVIILLLIAVVLGVRSFISMPRSEDPQIELPNYNVLIVFPGTSSDDMEALIIDPIEDALKGVDKINVIRSYMRDGVASLHIEADYSVDRQDKYDEILREINRIRPTLPMGIIRFDVDQIKPADRVAFRQYALSSDELSYGRLKELAEDLERELEEVGGINKISIEAYPAKEIRISLDYERMAAQNITLSQLIGILQSNNVNIPGGEVSTTSKYFTIKTTGGYSSLEDIRKAIVGGGEQGIVYLRDIADVDFDYADNLWKATYNGVKSIFISLKLKKGENILHVDRQVVELADKFSRGLPSNVSLNTAFEQASAVESRINDFFKNLIQGIALVGIIILLFLGWRSSVIIVILIPLSAILALSVLNGFGFGLQQISIASLVLALGLLVDNGIVVVENINRYIHLGHSRIQAALLGTREVSGAVASSTVTTLLSFFPLTQLGQGAGEFLKTLPLTVVFTLVISLVLSLTFSPILSRYLLKDVTDKKQTATQFFQKLSLDYYQPMLKGALRYRWLVLLFAIGITAFSISLFPKIGVSFFPTADKPLLLIDVETAAGSSLSHTEKAVEYVRSIVDTMSDVKSYTTNVGNGNPQVYYNRFPTNFKKETGQLLVNLTHWDPGMFYRTIASLREHFADYPDATITVEELKNGVPVQAPIEFRLFGEDINVLKSLAAQVEHILNKTEGLINIINPLKYNATQLEFELDREKAGMLNISELSFNQTVRASLNGLRIDEVIIDQERYPLILRAGFTELPVIDDFDKIYIATRTNQSVPLRHIAQLKFSENTPAFSHYNRKKYISVSSSLANLDNTIPTTLSLLEELDKIDWPSGYYYKVGGEYEKQQSTFGDLGIILLLAQIAIFAVLVLQFRSIRQPLIVFSAIPLAVSGGFIILYLTAWSFSFFAFVGLISLVGIVVNNSIILVDYSNQLQAQGLKKYDAIVEGAATRLKPILLTTFTTILGLLPLTLQGTNLWSPLCLTIIGGMISSTLLTLFVVPILYNLISRERAGLQEEY